jgi:hypothetical protein
VVIAAGHYPSGSSVRSGVTIPRIWITVAISLLLHALAFWQVRPDLHKPSDDEALKGEARGPLSVRIAPPPRPRPPVLALRPSPPAPTPAPRPSPPAPTPAPRRVVPREPPRPKPAPPPRPPRVIARSTPAEAPRVPVERPAPAVPPPAARAPAPAAPQGDLASYIEARRRARAEAAPAPPPSEPAPSAPRAEDPNERANRIAALNLGTNRTPTFGAPRRGGGVFTIRHMAYDYAEFLFYGWNKDIKRNTAQVIEVRKGNNPDIRIAVVRRMISIIREYESGDFVWESPRLDHKVTLSARPRDNAGLEAFLMKEFFEDDAR